MAISKETAKSIFPLPAYNYKVRIGDEIQSFAEVSGLSVQYDTITYRHGLSLIEGTDYFPGIQQPINLSLNRGIMINGSLLWNWIKGIRGDFVEKRDLIIDLCDETGHPVISWHVRNAWPTKLDAPAFNAGTNEVAVESIELIANGLEISYHS